LKKDLKIPGNLLNTSQTLNADSGNENAEGFDFKNQRFLSTLISNLPGYVYRVDKTDSGWRGTYFSDGILELTGYSSAELLGNGHLYYGLMVFREDSDLARSVVTKALIEKKPYQINYRIKAADGNIKWVWEQGRGVFNESGSLIATEGFVTDITEKKLAEEEILKKNEELFILNQTGQALTKLASPSEIVGVIQSMLGKLFDVSNLYIALYDEDEEAISFPYYSINGEKIAPGKRKFKDGLTEYILKTRESLLINTNVPETFERLEITLIGRECKSLMAVPVIAAEKVIGVITLQNYKDENSFTQSQIDILKTIASQAAIALENSRLYSEVHKDLKERSKAEEKIMKSLREKEILLQEVHHRVKNNLQIMSSLMKLQSKFITDPNVLDIFRESESRIKSMAIVHSKLYNTQDYERVDFTDYVKSLTENFRTTYGTKLQNVKILIDMEDIELNIDTAIPCGLMINELVSNAIKYAFPGNVPGEICICMKSDVPHSYTLIVKDNGIGMPAGIDIKNSPSLGLQLVTLLTGQLTGAFEINNSNGTEFKITFKEAIYKVRV
jgi:PAS domain S-box-containing protein